MFSIKDVEAHLEHEKRLDKKYPTHKWCVTWTSSKAEYPEIWTIVNGDAYCSECGLSANVYYMGSVYFAESWSVLKARTDNLTCECIRMEAALK